MKPALFNRLLLSAASVGSAASFPHGCRQSFGKTPFQSIAQFNANLVSICSHKFHGPKGVGALFFQSPLEPRSLMFAAASRE